MELAAPRYSEARSERPPDCPYCGHALSAQNKGVHLDLATNTLVIDAQALHLTPRQGEFMSVLIDAMPRIVDRAFIIQTLYPHEDGPMHQIIGVWCCHIRKRLKGTRLRLISHWGRGISLRYEESLIQQH